jgi:adenylate cyclase
MSLENLRKEIEEEVQAILSSDFKIEITETKVVPSLDDSDITYPNLETKVQKCKLIETCVLYIDLRKSTELNLTHRRETMSKLYSTFIRSVMKAADNYGGKVRNVVGDRVMVVFDSEGCFGNAYRTAVLLYSVVSRLLNQYFKNNEVKAGIGIDYGKMLVTKGGIIKKESENTNYKSLVWLGRPANIASKLTDLANKTISEEFKYPKKMVSERQFYPRSKQVHWEVWTVEEFLEERLIHKEGKYFEHISDYFDFYYTFTSTETIKEEYSYKPILMTDEVYQGVIKEATDMNSVKEGWIKEEKNIKVPGYNGKVYGVDCYFKAFE